MGVEVWNNPKLACERNYGAAITLTDTVTGRQIGFHGNAAISIQYRLDKKGKLFVVAYDWNLRRYRQPT